MCLASRQNVIKLTPALYTGFMAVSGFPPKSSHAPVGRDTDGKTERERRGGG